MQQEEYWRKRFCLIQVYSDKNNGAYFRNESGNDSNEIIHFNR